MNLLKEIEFQIVEILNSGISNKDILIFNYLSDERYKNLNFKDLQTMEKICFSSFADSNKDVKNLVKREQGTTPYQGFHYSNNIIELLAMAIQDFQFEANHLKEFLSNCSLKEQYIIKSVFPTIELSPKETNSKIEILISKILHVDEPYKSLDIIIDALADSKDLFDLFIIKKAYKKVYELSTNHEVEKDLDTFIKFYENLINRLEYYLKIVIGGLIIIFLGAFITFLSYIIINYWDSWGLEPYITVVSIIVGFLGTIISSILLWQKPKLKDLYLSWVNRFVDEWFYNRYSVFKKNLDKIAVRRKNSSNN